jgi:hypothetical protein
MLYVSAVQPITMLYVSAVQPITMLYAPSPFLCLSCVCEEVGVDQKGEYKK